MRCSAIAALVAVGTCVPVFSSAASIVQARAADVPGCARARVPTSDSELEARAARIGGIEFAIGDVFDAAEGRGGLYRIANRLHPDTRETTLRAQLLFAPGELYRRRVLDETERSLRKLRFLYDAQVEPVSYDTRANEVHVRVCTRDVWALSPAFSFSRSGGENSSSLELEDYNVFGSGQRIKLASKRSVDRTGTVLSWDAPNVRGTRWQVSADYQANSDGGLRALSAIRPFYSLDAQRAFGAALVDSRSRERLYSAGEPVVEFAASERNMELWMGRSSGLDAGWARRYLAGWTFNDQQFDLLPDRRLSYPWVGVQWIEDRFTQTHDLDQLGRTEDMNLGFVADVRAGLATSAFGSDRNSMVLSGTASWTDLLRQDQLLTVNGRLSTRLQQDGAQNTDFTLATRIYRRWSRRWVSFAGLDSRWTRNLDPNEQVLLGGENGLRGFPLRFQNGTASALVTLEQRLFTQWEPFGLVRVGGAAFAEAGRTWGARTDAEGGHWLKDIGVGLRLGNRRSSRGNVIHIDLAMPLDARDRAEGLQLFVATKTSF